jgi:hypothetical protein
MQELITNPLVVYASGSTSRARIARLFELFQNWICSCESNYHLRLMFMLELLCFIVKDMGRYPPRIFRYAIIELRCYYVQYSLAFLLCFAASPPDVSGAARCSLIDTFTSLTICALVRVLALREMSLDLAKSQAG